MTTKPESSKKLTIIRLVIYCVLAALPLCVVTPIVNSFCGELMFSENASADTLRIAQIIVSLAMFAPAAAHLLTRIITKEGFKDLMLFPNFKGNIKYYVASVGVKLLESAVLIVLVWLIVLGGEKVFDIGEGGVGIAAVITQIAVSIIMFFPAFGEEWGWRGYMMPKLMELMPKPAAVIVGGIIWGLWHAPVTVSGHNFGTEYAGFPYVGIALMCLLCILMNAFLTLLTERTGSIYPASIAHMVNNNCSPFVLLTTLTLEGTMERISAYTNIKLFFIEISVLAVTGIVSFILLIKKPRKTLENSK
ncbi:MAG: CPBP family intramembrane glutamic endopeptidase [Oscillospiraceae bacterium]